MRMECWHLSVSTVTRLPMARTETQLRTLVRMVVRAPPRGVDRNTMMGRLPGARGIDGWQPLLFQVMLRIGVRTIVRAAGIRPQELTPMSDGSGRAAGAARMVEAAATAVAAGPTLADRTAVVLRARRAAVHLGALVGVADEEMCWALGIGRRPLRRLRKAPPEPRVLAATRVQMALDAMALEPLRPSRELRSWARGT